MVHVPWLDLRLVGVRLLVSMISFKIFPFLDCFCLQVVVYISSFAPKSQASFITWQKVCWFDGLLLAKIFNLSKYVHLSVHVFVGLFVRNRRDTGGNL